MEMMEGKTVMPCLITVYRHEEQKNRKIVYHSKPFGEGTRLDEIAWHLLAFCDSDLIFRMHKIKPSYTLDSNLAQIRVTWFYDTGEQVTLDYFLFDWIVDYLNKRLDLEYNQ